MGHSLIKHVIGRGVLSAEGYRMVMHENALLRAELREVREANEILSLRRRVKRIRLQKGGVMTVGEARDLIDQMDVDMQVVAESSRSGGQGRGSALWYMRQDGT
jgi:2,3-bisphosphoglycerate-independent phosphoglycerate mutase